MLTLSLALLAGFGLGAAGALLHKLRRLQSAHRTLRRAVIRKRMDELAQQMLHTYRVTPEYVRLVRDAGLTSERAWTLAQRARCN